MKKSNLLSRAEMRKVLGGNLPTEGEILPEEGRCVECECEGVGHSCWYSRRSAGSLCADVCGSASFIAIDPVPCGSCILN